MGYIKQNFVPNQTLTAEELNYMDNQISANEIAIESVKESVKTSQASKQDKLVSGTNIKTINGESILGSGNITIQGGIGTVDPTGYATEQWVKDQNYTTKDYVDGEIANVTIPVIDVKVNDISVVEDNVANINLGNYVTDVQIDGTSITVNGIANIDKLAFKGDKGDTGPQGPKGDNGTSVTIKGSFASIEELQTAYNAYLSGDSSKFTGGTLIAGDGYLVNGELYVYDGAGNDFDSSWENVGKIKGDDGKDGISLFKSTAFTRSNEKPSKAPEGGNWDSPIPTNTDDEGNLIWSDGVPTGSDILWVTTCTFAYKNSEFESNWSDPVKMVDTVDFEVIYGTVSADISKLPSLPITEGLNNYYGWYDNDTDITNNEDIKWMATASCKNDVWSNWKVTQIKGEKGDTPIVKFTSIVFRRTNDILTNADTPSGGDFDNPWPEGDLWSDGIPDGTEILWSSSRVFSNDEIHSSWSNPVQMTDTANFEVIYGIEDARTEDLPTLPITEGFASKGWYDDVPTNVENIIWMATATCKNGIWSSWTVTRIKGEKGDPGKKGEKGDDGTSVKILGTLNSSDELETLTNKEAGDGYLIDGNLWVYTGAPDNDTNTKHGFTNVGKIKGEDGKQVYLHIKYATKVIFDDQWKPIDVTLTAAEGEKKEGETQGPWMGQYSDYTKEDSDNPLDYTWFNINASEAVTTKLGEYYITSNSIIGKTMQSTQTTNLVKDTTFTKVNEDGTLDPEKLTSDGSTEGPVWQISKDGEGHLAKGNIRWTKEGDVTFGENVSLSWNSDWDQEATRVTQNTIRTYKISADYIEGGTIDASKITVENIDASKITSGTIDASKITVENITVDELDTKPKQTDNNNKITIKENKISVYSTTSNEDSPCVLLSNDTIGNINTSDLTNDSLSQNDLNLISNIEWNNNSVYKWDNELTNSVIKPVKSWNNSGQYFNIGLVNDGGEITFKNILVLLSDNKLKAENICIVYGKKPNEGQVYHWGILNENPSITQEGQVPSLSIAIERLVNNIWTEEAVLTTTTDDLHWEDYGKNNEVLPGTTISKSGMGKACLHTYEVKQRGIYRAQIEFNPKCVTCDGNQYSDYTVVNSGYAGKRVSEFATNALLQSFYEVKRGFEGINYSEFGKNGMVVKSNNNVFVIDDNEVAMTNKDYGIKLNTDGVHAWDKTLKMWKKLDFSKIYDE